MDYRLYVDEAGTHNPCTDETEPIGRRYLGLTGVAIPRGERYQELCEALEDFKRRHLPYDPDDPPILHREDIKERRGAFRVLQDATRRLAFDAELLALLDRAPLWVVSVVIDKYTHGQATHRTLQHPYHYCLLALLQRYCGWLDRVHERGDLMVEARGKTEDRLFECAYSELYERGGPYLDSHRTQATLTSCRPKVKPKAKNIAGLQIADLLAHPLTRDVLVSVRRLPHRGGAFAEQVATMALKKYNRRMWDGRVAGYGRVLLN